MSPNHELDNARCMLLTLLPPIDGDAPVDVDVENLSIEDYLVLLVTSSATIITYALCMMGDGQRDLANEGLTNLIMDMRKAIDRRCLTK